MFNSVGMIFISASFLFFILMAFSGALLLDSSKRVVKFAEVLIVISCLGGVASALIGITINAIGY